MAALGGAALSWRNKIVLIACLDVWRPVAASVCQEVQHSTLPRWLHPFPGSLQVKFYLFSQKTDTLLDDFCVLNFSGHEEALCLHSLDCSLVSGSYFYMDPSFFHSYKMDKTTTGSRRNLFTMACEASTRSHFWSALRHLGTHFLRALSYLKSDN
jgi:hypothetical protein